jgi:hypothetical protein
MPPKTSAGPRIGIPSGSNAAVGAVCCDEVAALHFARFACPGAKSDADAVNSALEMGKFRSDFDRCGRR